MNVYSVQLIIVKIVKIPFTFVIVLGQFLFWYVKDIQGTSEVLKAELMCAMHNNLDR